MKKALSIFLILCMMLCVFASCGAKEADYTLSVGTALTEDLEALSVSATVAAVVTDKDGKVVLCRLDAVDISTSVENGAVKAVAADTSKYEKGDGYGMREYGKAIAEWFKQAEYFEEYVVGKTLAEIEGIKTGDAELTAGCTIDVTDFVKAIKNAMELEHKVSFTSAEGMTLGLAIKGEVADASGNAEFVFDSAAAVALDGKVVSAIIDCADATVNVADGKGSAFDYKGTKLQLGDKYGMVQYGQASAEWYAQAQSFADTAVGKAPSEVSNLPVENVSGCTMDADPLKVILVKAAKNIR